MSMNVTGLQGGLQDVEDLLVERRRAFFSQWPAKVLARDLGCEIRTANGYRVGNRPAPQAVEVMVQVWGQVILDVLYGPLLAAPDLALSDRLARVAADTLQIKRDLEAFHAGLGRARLQDPQPGSAPAYDDAGASGQPDRRAGAAAGGCGPGADGAGDLDSRMAQGSGKAVRPAVLRAVTASVFCLCLIAQMTVALTGADFDMRRAPAGPRIPRPPVTRVLRGGGSLRGGTLRAGSLRAGSGRGAVSRSTGVPV